MIDGKKYLIFHPNTIVYAIPYEQSAAARRAKIGVVWHTTYKGSTFETMKASYGVKVSSLKNSPDVWSQDAILRDVTNATMTKRETQDVNEILTQIGTIFNQISGSTLRELEANKALGDHIQQYNNLFIKKGQIIGNEVAHTEKLVRWIKSKYAKEASTRKTQKGKSNVRQKRDDLLTFFSLKNKVNLVDVFRLQKLIVLAKLKLINKLNRLQALDTFVKTNKGFKVTGQEGFVAIDKLGGDAVKIVDRLEFSYNNWSPNILKGWDKPN
jgi:hypothetical protein